MSKSLGDVQSQSYLCAHPVSNPVVCHFIEGKDTTRTYGENQSIVEYVSTENMIFILIKILIMNLIILVGSKLPVIHGTF